jgi:hypothetical protein
MIMLLRIWLTAAFAMLGGVVVIGQDTVFTVSGQVFPCIIMNEDTSGISCRTLDTSITETFTFARTEIVRVAYFNDAQSKQTQAAAPADSFRYDTIYTADSKKILGQVVEIDPEFITYVLSDTGNSERYVLPTTSVNSIHFSSGTIDKIGQLISTRSREEYYRLGVNDAMLYYDHKRDFRAGMLSGAMTYVFYAGIVMIIVEHRRPPVLRSNPNNPNDDLLFSNKDYAQGYADVAKSKRRKKLNQGYVVGLVAAPAVFVAGAIVIFAVAYTM